MKNHKKSVKHETLNNYKINVVVHYFCNIYPSFQFEKYLNYKYFTLVLYQPVEVINF